MVKKQTKKSNTKSTTGVSKKVLAVAGIALASGAAVTGAYFVGANSHSGPSAEDIELMKADSFKEGVDSVDVELIKTTAFAEGETAGIASVEIPEPEVQTIEVDNENLDLVLDEIYDEDGDVEYLLDDLDDDEVDLIVDRIVFKNEAKTMAEAIVDAELVEFIDDEEDIFGEGDLEDYRDNDVYKVIIDSDDTVFEVEDFDDKEATVYVEAKLKLDNDDDKTYVKVIAEVEIENGKAEIVDVTLKEDEE